MSDSIKVMIVDDSALVRQTFKKRLLQAPDIEIVAVAPDSRIAAERMRSHTPDVLLLDVETPRTDGLKFLQTLMSEHPIPVIVCSSQVAEGSETLAKALAAGAVDIIQKPTVNTRISLDEACVSIADSVRAAARIRPVKRVISGTRVSSDDDTPFSTKSSQQKSLRSSGSVPPRNSADVMLPAPDTGIQVGNTEKVIVIGASTGGTDALTLLLRQMPLDCPGIVIVQHMPEGFTTSFAARLNSQCDIEVREARDDDQIVPGQALIAPGSHHVMLSRSNSRYSLQVKDGPLVCRHRPSVDVLFRSAASCAGHNALAAILTGMGSDGAKGMRELFDCGAWTCAQDEQSCVVYGMPREAVKLGGTSRKISLPKIADALLNAASPDNQRRSA